MTDDNAIALLHATLSRRDTPEAVAELIGQALPPRLARRLKAPLQVRIAASIKRRFGWSSMPTMFEAPVRADRILAKARELALLFLGGTLPEGDDPAEVERLMEEFNLLIGRQPGASNFKSDQLDRSSRASRGLVLSRRRYDKLFRLTVRLEERLVRLRVQEARYRLLLVGKAALAPQLTLAQLGTHMPTGTFVAYYAARMKLRSEFTISGHQKPFDDLAAALLATCEEEPEMPWYGSECISTCRRYGTAH